MCWFRSQAVTTMMQISVSHHLFNDFFFVLKMCEKKFKLNVETMMILVFLNDQLAEISTGNVVIINTLYVLPKVDSSAV